MNPSAKVGLRFGEWLVKKGLLTHKKLTETLAEQQTRGGRLGEVLRRMNLLEDKQVTEALAEYLSLSSAQLDDITAINMNIARLVPEHIAKRFGLVALRELGDRVIVAMADPLNIMAMDTVRMKLKRKIEVVVSSEKDIRQAIEAIYHGSDIEEQQLRDLVEIEAGQEEEDISVGLDGLFGMDSGSEVDASKVPVIRFVDLLLSQASKNRASDIHIEPQENSMAIRIRIDGILQEAVPPARTMQAAVTTRIKILANMNIAERRLPQDGRFQIRKQGRAIDMRVSVMPTIYGEKVVIRLLDAAAINHDLDSLGFEGKHLKELKSYLSQPHGIIIVTGPTGSGKSTTLYSALTFLRDPKKNIVTVEDPVEYRLKGINQIQVKSEIDLDFPVCLRSILRQDPDIILIGEMRDKDTIDIAMNASLTGHLVLSTFHTNDAPGTLSRLLYMGVEPYLLASTLKLVIAQRLVRRICEHCKEPISLDNELLRQLKIDPNQTKDTTFYHGKGCQYCNGTGYIGRLPLYEFLPLGNQIATLLVKGGVESQIRAMAREKGYGSLLDVGVKKMIEGVTTAEEVARVSYIEDAGI